MINRQSVTTAVNGLLEGAFPSAAVYKNREPENLIRPSFLVMSPKSKTETSTCNAVLETVYLTITCFGAVDDFGNSDADELAQMQQEVIDLFRGGCINVGSRAVKVSASGGGQDLDRAWVEVTISYHEMRDRNPAVLPLIETVNTIIKGD